MIAFFSTWQFRQNFDHIISFALGYTCVYSGISVSKLRMPLRLYHKIVCALTRPTDFLATYAMTQVSRSAEKIDLHLSHPFQKPTSDSYAGQFGFVVFLFLKF